MKHSSFNRIHPAVCHPHPQEGSARVVLLAAACLLLGGAGSAYWFYHGSRPETPPPVANPAARQLSEVTRAVLRRLEAPIEIRFYSSLDPASVSPSDRAFAGRSEALLSAYQQEGGGKVKLTTFNAGQSFNPDAASADGIKPFNLDKGSACFLGIVVAQDARKEVIPQISADWEPALETDVTRAIVRLIDAKPPGAPVAPAQTDPALLEEVKRAVPNFATLPLEEGEAVLHDAALKELKAAATDADAQAKEARQQFTDAQSAGSEPDMRAARQRLQKIQADQMEKFKEIGAKSQAQVEALRQLRKSAAK